MGGHLGGTGAVPQKNLSWGTAHASVPHNIWRSSVMECSGKYEVLKKCDMKKNLCCEICEIEVFRQKRVIIFGIYPISDSRDW